MEKPNNNNNYYLLFASCIPVKGAQRSIIVDNERENMFFITNEMYELIAELKQSPYQSVIDDYDHDSKTIIDGYLKFLQDNELGFWTTEPERFPDISLEWEHPSLITNAIIDNNVASIHNWEDIFAQLEGLGCRDIQIRCYDDLDITWISNLMQLLETSRIKSVEFIIKYNSACTKKYLKALTEEYFRIKTITVHSSPVNEVFIMRTTQNRCGMGNIMYVTQRIDNNTHCGQISEKYFSMSGIRSFTEAKNFNSCLNRKISINFDGSIMNCPSLSQIYGNVKTQSLASVINDNFKQVWFVNKDQISICQDCEFRYVCTDCRAFLENAFDKPKKCSYNPYSLTWEN